MGTHYKQLLAEEHATIMLLMAPKMAMKCSDVSEWRVAAETIYTCLYALPQGALRYELLDRLRKASDTSLPRTHGTDRRGQLADRLSIHVILPARRTEPWRASGRVTSSTGRINAWRWKPWSSGAHARCCWRRCTMPPPTPP